MTVAPGAAPGFVKTRCDPFGAESRIRLLGGMYPESHVGRIMWHCQNAAAGRWRMVCQGGQYGGRVANDGGLVVGYDCPGGHRGQEMPLCVAHRRMLARRQAGLCPACAWPPAARIYIEQLEHLQTDIYARFAAGDLAGAAAGTSLFEQGQAAVNELTARGIVHRCPLKLEEVS